LRLVFVCAVFVAAHLSAAELEPTSTPSSTLSFSQAIVPGTDFAQSSLYESVMSLNQPGSDDLETSLREIDSLGVTGGFQPFSDAPPSPDSIFFTIGVDLSCSDCRISTSSLPSATFRQ